MFEANTSVQIRKPLLYPAELPPHFGAARVASSPRRDKGKTTRVHNTTGPATNTLSGATYPPFSLFKWLTAVHGFITSVSESSSLRAEPASANR